MATGDRHLLAQWVTRRDANAFRRIADEYGGMLYATCRRVLRDNAEAEDVAQECLTALIELRDLPDSPFLGPWLHSIATRKALMRLRSNARRRAREAAFADASEDVTEPAWNDLAHLVDEAIAELPDDLRVPLLAHYFQGESHGVIARTLGLPRRTVSHRIARGVQRVGDLLKKRGVTVSVAALGALLQTNLAEAATLPAALSALIDKTLAAHAGQAAAKVAVTGGIRAMLIKVAMLAGMAAGVSGFWWMAQDVDDTVRPSIPATASQTGTERDAILLAQSASDVQSATNPSNQPAASESLSGDALVHIQVVDERANPEPRADVEMHLWRDPEASDPTAMPPILRGVTDANGEIVFDNLAQESFAIRAKSGDRVGFAWAYKHNLYTRARIVLMPAKTAVLRITDAQQRPVAGASLYVLQTEPRDQRDLGPGRNVYAGQTAADGAMQIAIPERQSWRVLVVVPNHAARVEETIVGGAAYDIALSDGVSLAGQLHAENPGISIAGITITAASTENELDRRSVTSDATGRFQIPHLNPGAYAVAIESDEIALRDGMTVANAGATDKAGLQLNAVPGAAFSGIVRTDADGLSIEGARVTATLTANGRIRRSANTDANGRYRIAGLAPGSYEVRVRDTRENIVTSNDLEDTVTLDAGANRNDVHFTLPKIPAVTAFVEGSVTHEGAPVAAYVLAFGRQGLFGAVLARTDDAGRFRFDNFPTSRDLYIRAFRPGLACEETVAHGVPPQGLSGLNLAMQPTGSLSGRVIGTPSGRPLDANTHVIEFLNAYAWGVDVRSICTVLDDGRFLIGDLPAGEHGLYLEQMDGIMRSGIRLPDATFTLASGEHLTGLEIAIDDRRGVTPQARAARKADEDRMLRESRERAKRAWGIKGRVTNARTGEPVTAYFLSAREMGESRQDVTDKDGRFTIDPQDTERRIVRIEAAGFQPSETYVVPDDVRDGFVELKIALQPGPVIAGNVQDAAGNPVEGARVFPNALPDDLQSMHPRFPTTGRDGRFRLDILEPNAQTLFVERTGFPITRVDVDPKPSGVTEIVVTLPRGVRIEGRVTSNGVPAANTRVSAYAEWHASRQPAVQTDADGRFVFDDVAEGTVRVNAWSSNDGTDPTAFRYQTRELDAKAGGVYEANFDFKERTNTIRGAVTFNGEAVDNASVYASMQTGGTRESNNSSQIRAGGYELGPLPPGRAVITATLRTPGTQTALQQRAEIELGEGEAVTVDFHFTGTASINGAVGNLLPGEPAGVIVVPAAAGTASMEAMREVQVAEVQVVDGAFALDGLAPGRYTLYAVSRDALYGTADPARMATATITLTEGQAATVDLSF